MSVLIRIYQSFAVLCLAGYSVYRSKLGSRSGLIPEFHTASGALSFGLGFVVWVCWCWC